LLLESIQDIKPPLDSPPETQASSRYQFLSLRYVESEPVDRITSLLAIGKRQVFRRQDEALDAVADALHRRLQPLKVDRTDRGNVIAASPHASIVAQGNLQSEVERIGAVRPRLPLDLGPVIGGALEIVANLSLSHSQKIQVALPSRLLPVLIDRTALRQAIISLLMVFIRESESGDIQLSGESIGDEVFLRFAGRTEKPHDLVGRFEQDSNLVVSRQLIELQGGTLTWRANSTTVEAAIGLLVARPKTVLVVDDNADTRQLLARILEGYSYQVTVATNGEEAIEEVSRSRPDAVILDVMLPAADGWEVLHILRSAPETASLPVIVCTVLEQQELAQSLGATDFVLKPISQGALLAALDRCWRRSHSVNRG
jgi:CheY-like chemotaxis protein